MPGGSPYATLALLHGGEFSWTRFDVHPSVLIGCLALALLYFRAIHRGSGEAGVSGSAEQGAGSREQGAQASPAQILCFTGGLLVMFVALNGPIHELSDYFLFSAHMVQHLLLTLIMPPLLLIGTPAWLMRKLVAPRGVPRSEERRV